MEIPGASLALQRDAAWRVFGKTTELTTPLAGGDRAEVYRPITVDPKTLSRPESAMLDQVADDDWFLESGLSLSVVPAQAGIQ